MGETFEVQGSYTERQLAMKRIVVLGLILVLTACAPAAQVATPTAEVVEQTQPPSELTTDTPAETSTSTQAPAATEAALNHATLLDELLFSISSVEAGEAAFAVSALPDPFVFEEGCR